MKVVVLGIGYVGSVVAGGFASHGHYVTAVDNQPHKVEMITRGEAPVFERGLSELLKQSLASGHLSATMDLKQTLLDAEVIFFCVETPSADDGSIDLTALKQAISGVMDLLPADDNYRVFVVKSTVIPGTCEKVVRPLLEKNINHRFGLCMNPEFLRQGSAVNDFLKPDRIVIGEMDTQSGAVVTKLHQNFPAPLIRTTMTTAEMIKYAANSLLATMISFSNELANICEHTTQVDVRQVLEAVHLDRRLSDIHGSERVPSGITEYLMAGCGYGGSCLPKDIKAYIDYAGQLGYNPKLLKAVEEINQNRSLHLVDMAEEALGTLSGRRVAVLGLSFKPDTDDIRYTPAMPVVGELLSRKAQVVIYDPQAMNNFQRAWQTPDDFLTAQSAIEALSDADAAIFLTAWEEFRKISLQNLPELMCSAVVIDGRGIFDPQVAQRYCVYRTLGLGTR